MKALSVVWRIPDERLPAFAGIATGLVVVRDMCEYLGRKIESYLLLGKEYLPAMKLGNIHIVDSESTAADCAGKSHLEIMSKVFEKALADIRPDIVHFHDCGDFCRACMELCIKKHVPYIFTAHGFVRKSQAALPVEKRTCNWQQEVYTIPDIHIVAVGKGLARKILEDYPNLTPEQLKVIQNGTDFEAEIIQSGKKSQLGLEGKKILICPGTINRRKNQLQIVRAFQMLPQAVSETIGIIFCGNDRLDGALQDMIQSAELADRLKYAGVLNNAQMKEYYSIADGFITASLSEGLSIAALEAMTYGLPLIMFSDLECAADLSDTRISCFAEGRTDQALALAIEKWALNQWDYNAILKCAEHFSMKRVADEYIACYQDITNKV